MAYEHFYIETLINYLYLCLQGKIFIILMNEIVVNKIICDVINGKLKYEENSDAFSEIENKELTLYINYLLCDIYHKLGDSAQMIEIDD